MNQLSPVMNAWGFAVRASRMTPDPSPVWTWWMRGRGRRACPCPLRGISGGVRPVWMVPGGGLPVSQRKPAGRRVRWPLVAQSCLVPEALPWGYSR